MPSREGTGGWRRFVREPGARGRACLLLLAYDDHRRVLSTALIVQH